MNLFYTQLPSGKRRHCIQALLCVMLIAFSYSTRASDVYLSLDTYDYRLDVLDRPLNYRAYGEVIGGTIDINEYLYGQYQLGQWSDDTFSQSAGLASRSSLDSTLYTLGLGYELDAWDVFLSYTVLDDDIELSNQAGGLVRIRPGDIIPPNNVRTETESSSLRFDASYTIEQGRLSYKLGAGAQYDDSRTTISIDSFGPQVNQSTESLYATLNFSTDYFFGSDSRGWFVGASVRWFQELSANSSDDFLNTLNDVEQISLRPNMPGFIGGAGRAGNGNANINRSSGTSYGLLSVYATFVFNDHWSIDASPTVGFSGEQNSNSGSITLSYRF